MKPETTYKGVVIKTYVKEHDKYNDKMVVEFSVKGTEYNNGTIISKRSDEQELEQVHKKLIVWAQTVIKENV